MLMKLPMVLTTIFQMLDQILLGQLAPQITILKIILPGQMLNFPVLHDNYKHNLSFIKQFI